MQKITYAIHDTELGAIVIGQTVKGLCWLGFMTTVEQGAYKGDGLTRLLAHYEGAAFIEDKAVSLLWHRYHSQLLLVLSQTSEH